jgi:hypothetical protein
MYYFLDHNNQIQADIAYRIGRIAIQYDTCSDRFPPEQKFDDTLHICLLQTLLTSCSELIRAMGNNEMKLSPFPSNFDSANKLWGLENAEILQNTFRREKVTNNHIITHMRDSLSHPARLDLHAEYISTGYTAVEANKMITDFVFISSPDVRRDRPKPFHTQEEAQLQLAQGGFPKGTVVYEIGDGEKKYQLWYKGNPYARIFQIKVPVGGIKTLVRGLSNYLAQPIKKNWDGETFTNIIGEERVIPKM